MNEIDKFIICDNSVGPTNSNWNHNETLLFIDFYRKFVLLKEQGHKHDTIFSLLSKKLLENGYQKTKTECRRKFNNLTRTFRSIDKRPEKNHQKFPYYQVMKEILEGSDSPGPNPSVLGEIEDFVSDPLLASTLDPWKPAEIRCLIAVYGHKKSQAPHLSINWLDVLLDLQNNGFASKRTDLDCRGQLHKHLKNYINIVGLGDEKSYLESPYYQDFQKIMENFEEWNTDLSVWSIL
jgi:hypothetical protein